MIWKTEPLAKLLNYDGEEKRMHACINELAQHKFHNMHASKEILRFVRITTELHCTLETHYNTDFGGPFEFSITTE